MAKPAPSEWGKLNAGQSYGVLAIDLGRAIFGVSWGKYELPLVYRLIEHSWRPARTKGRTKKWPDPEPCHLNINDLANQLGYPRQRLYEARDRLKAMSFLIEAEDGFWLNKNAHEWVDPETGQPVLTPKMLAYAIDGRKRSNKSDKKPDVTPQRDTDKRSSVTPQRDTAPSACNAPALHDVTPQRDTMSRPSVTSHIEDRARRDFKTKEELSSATLPQVTRAPEKTAIPPCPTDETAPLPPLSGNHTPTREQVELCWGILWEHFGATEQDKARLANGYYEHQRHYCHEDWLAAIRETYRRRKLNVASIHYIETIAADYARNGRPKHEPKAGTADIVPFTPKPVKYHEKRSTRPIVFTGPNQKRG